MGIKKMKQFKTLRERFKKTKTMKDIMRVHGRALKKAERSGNLELPSDVEDALKSWVFKNEPYVGDDPDDFDEWLDDNIEDIVKGKIKESVEEATDLYNKDGIQITRFSKGKGQVGLQIDVLHAKDRGTIQIDGDKAGALLKGLQVAIKRGVRG